VLQDEQDDSQPPEVRALLGGIGARTKTKSDTAVTIGAGTANGGKDGSPDEEYEVRFRCSRCRAVRSTAGRTTARRAVASCRCV
jgi:hypothetical protein